MQKKILTQSKFFFLSISESLFQYYKFYNFFIEIPMGHISSMTHNQELVNSRLKIKLKSRKRGPPYIKCLLYQIFMGKDFGALL